MKQTTKTLLTLSAATLICSSASAVSNWTGSVDGTWENAGNWTGGLPVIGDQSFIEGATNPDVTLSSAGFSRRILVDEGRTLFIADGGTLTTSGSVEVIGDNSIGFVVVQDGGTYNRTGTLDTRFAGSTVTVEDGGTFSLDGAWSSEGAGSGFIVSGSTASVTMGSVINNGAAGILTLNDSAGMTVTGNMDLGSTAAISIGAESTLNIGGLMSYGGAFSISSDTVLANGVYNLFNLTGTESGDFSSVTLSGAGYGDDALSLSSDVWTATVGSQDYSFSQITGDLTVVPEPGTYALIGGLLALGYVMVRHRA